MNSKICWKTCPLQNLGDCYIMQSSTIGKIVRVLQKNIVNKEHVRCCTTMHLPTNAKLRVFIWKNRSVVLDHPPYSPDLRPWDFWVFLKLKLSMKWNSSDIILDIQEVSTAIHICQYLRDCKCTSDASAVKLLQIIV